IWTDLLTDHDGPYNEIQSGRYETQLNQEFMPPQRVESWAEYWYPVHGLGGGFVEATNELALNVRFVEASGSKPAHAVVALDPTVEISGLKMVATLGEKPLREFGSISCEPQKPVVLELVVDDLETARKSLVIEIKDSTARSLLHWSAADPLDGNRDFVSSAGSRKNRSKAVKQMTIEELYQRGVEQEKNGDSEGAARTYDQVLRRKPGYVPALLKLARRDYAAADLNAAQQKIGAALAQSPDDPAAQYAAGIVHRAAGRWAAAERALSASVRALGPSVPALVQLGEISIHEKKYEQAARRLREALNINSGNALAASDLAVSLRLAGKPGDAAAEAEKALDLMPLLPFALVEKWRDQSVLASEGSAGSADGWKKVLSFDVQNYLEVAAWYGSLGDWPSSDAVLAEALKDFPTEKISPMVFYYLASNAREEGNSAQAEEFLTKAAAVPSDRVFPQRLSDARVLSDALAHHPTDARAHDYLGTFLFAHDRFEEAAKEWRQARTGGLEDPVLNRNLGVYEWRVNKNLPQAARYYEQAIRLAPGHYRYYPELDEIYAQLGETSKRDSIFSQAPAEVLNRDTVRVRRALLYAQEGEFANALGLFNGHDFKPWEGGAIVRQIFVLANLSEGRTLLAENKSVKAEQAFRRALEYPVNLGVGKPDKPHDEEAWYWLGAALAAEGKANDAREAWSAAAKEGSTADGVSAVFAAGALMKLGRADEANKILESIRGAAGQPGASARALYAAGLAERLLDHEPAAQENFRRALELDPSIWQARFELDRTAKAAPAR
ncbi:MAG TPA: tetratricopeptide repeat protein, partial [Terriglobia bacterium]|nr:tetratricopeptide repeat protein [Terriglobia bacterium]